MKPGTHGTDGKAWQVSGRACAETESQEGLDNVAEIPGHKAFRALPFWGAKRRLEQSEASWGFRGLRLVARIGVYWKQGGQIGGLNLGSGVMWGRKKGWTSLVDGCVNLKKGCDLEGESQAPELPC